MDYTDYEFFYNLFNVNAYGMDKKKNTFSTICEKFTKSNT